MKIRTKLNLNAIVTALLLAIFVSGILLFIYTLGRSYEKQRLAEEITEASFQSILLENKYTYYPNESVRMEWASVYEKQARLLEKAEPLFLSAEKRSLLSNIQNASVEEKLLFEELARNIEEGGSETIIQELNSQLAIKAQEHVSNTLRLSDVSRQEITSVQRQFYSTLIILGLLVAAFYIVSYWSTHSLIVALETLEKDFTRISALDFTSNHSRKPKDEIDALRRAFDIMVIKLKHSYLDIEKKVSERTYDLKKREHFFDSVLENLPLMVFVKDAENLRFTHFNKAGETLLGYSRKELLGKNDYDFFTKDQADFFTKKDREVLKNAKLYDILEEPIETKNKEKRILHTMKIPILDSHGTPLYLLGISQDVTVEKQKENELLQLKAKNEAIFASLGDGLAIADKTGKLTYFNKPAKHILGIGTTGGLADTWQKKYGIFDPVTLVPLLTEQMPLFLAVNGKAANKVELFIRNSAVPEGKFISVTATPIVSKGEILGGVAIFRDMTEEREIDRAKTEFVSIASHQLRTPLTAISWYAELLLHGDAGKLSVDQKKYTREIYQSNQIMIELVNTLLNISRIELGTLKIESKQTDIIALAQSVLAQEKSNIVHKKLKVEKNFSDIPTIIIDPTLLRIVLQNLIANSIAYTPIGGKI